MAEEYINTDNSVVDIDTVIPNNYNPKLSVDDDENNHYEFEKIRSSIQVAGQIQPVLVRELEDGKFEIINGYHRHRAMTELGLKKIEIKNLGKIDFDTAVSRALLTEETKVPIDNIELAHLMKKVITKEKPIEYWADLLPYTPDLIQQKVEMLAFDFENYGGKGGDGEDDDLDTGKYTFTVKDADDIAMIEEVLDQAGANNDEAFVAICRAFPERN